MIAVLSHIVTDWKRKRRESFIQLLACYRSGQMSEAQWRQHREDPSFDQWLSQRSEEMGA